jgi:hypothetical protein
MFKQALADNADIGLFSSLKAALRPITLNVAFYKYQKLTL